MANDLSDIRALITSTISEVACDDAMLQPASSGDGYAVRVNLRNPSEDEQIRGASWVRAKPQIRTSVAGVQDALGIGDVFVVSGRKYRVVSAPQRPGAGMWWQADVDDIGPA